MWVKVKTYQIQNIAVSLEVENMNNVSKGQNIPDTEHSSIIRGRKHE